MNEKSGNLRAIHFLEISGIFSADRKKVHTTIKFSDISPTASVELALVDALGIEISRSIILGILDPRLNFTLHLGSATAIEPIRLTCWLLNEDSIELHELSVEVIED